MHAFASKLQQQTMQLAGAYAVMTDLMKAGPDLLQARHNCCGKRKQMLPW